MESNGKVLRVVAKIEGFRRAGRQFGTKAVDIPLSVLTGKEVRALKHEPHLICTEIDPVTHVATDDLEALRDQARIGKALLAKLPADFHWAQCPTEYVTLLQDQVHDLQTEARELQGQVEHLHQLELEVETLRAAKPAADVAHAESAQQEKVSQDAPYATASPSKPHQHNARKR